DRRLAGARPANYSHLFSRLYPKVQVLENRFESRSIGSAVIDELYGSTCGPNDSQLYSGSSCEYSLTLSTQTISVSRFETRMETAPEILSLK
ncbi:unnamed protein product, partial [Oppiella nova]